MLKSKIKELVNSAIKEAYPKAGDLDFGVESADPKFGDYSTNVAMILAKRAGEKPEEIANSIVKNIKNDEIFEKVEVAQPGFINFKIAIPYLQQKISEIIEAGKKYGGTDLGKDLKVNVEFISANPTGPLTVGNSRGGVIGDALANILGTCGYKVTREYYFNDAGGQIDVLGHSILKDEQAQYKGDYIDELAKKITIKDYREIGKKAAQILIGEIKKTAVKMGINFDVWTAEGQDLREKGKIDKIIEWLKKENLAYEKDGAWWFKSTQFGDDKDRVIVRSNGEPTYFALDCAYHKDKFVERKFDRAINVWGADHYGDLARLKGFVKALGYEDKFDILMHQFVRIIKDGKEVRMSKRAGNYILVDDIIDEAGKDVYRFFMLQYAPNSHLVFDLGLAKEQSEKNPVYYIQYAYARISSILAKAGSVPSPNLTLIKEPAEIALIKEVIKLPDLVIEIAEDYQVQKLPHYTLELATKFHNFYEQCRVISEDENLTMARIALIKATQIVLKKTLDLMGISAPEKM